MSFNLDSLFIEWRSKVPTGVPNPKNDYHLVLLKEVCLNRGIDIRIVDNVLLALEQDDKKVDPETIVKYKGEDGEEKESQYSYASKQPEGSPAKVAADKLKSGDEDDTPKKDPTSIAGQELQSDPKQGGSYLQSKSDTDLEKDGDDSDGETQSQEEPKSQEKPKSKENLLSKDHDTVEKTLKYTETQAEKDIESGGREGVGLGTDTSRAGEAAVHTGIRMLQDKKSIDEIKEFLTNIAKDKDTFLNQKWVGATMSTLSAVEQKIGIKNIKDVSWDTPEGREAIGVDTKLKTSSDMFVRTNDGKNVGISLKQDGSVFLNNGGWAKQSKLLLEDLKEQMPDEEHAQLEDAMSIQNYNQDRAERFVKSASKYKAKDILEMTNSLSDEEIKKVKLSPYIDILRNPEELLEKINNKKMTGKDMKAFHRLLQIKDKEGEKYIRESDDFLTQKAFSVLNASDAAKKGMNKHVLKSMHVLDTLGLNKKLKDGGVDDFITMYGIPPDGAVLDEKNLTDLFGSEFGDVLLERIDEVRNGSKEPKDLEEFMADKIEINYDSGEILFKHENEMKYPLFYMAGRSRGIGSAPVMELGQTPFMALALKVGSFDTDNWTPEQQKKLSDELKKEKDERDAKRMEED